MAPMAPSSPAPPLDLSDLAAWLVAQRWFRSRTRELREVSVHDSIELSGDPSLLVMRASFVDGGEERYLVPIVAAEEGPREAADGDGVWRTLLALLATGPRTVSSSSRPSTRSPSGGPTGACTGAAMRRWPPPPG